MIQLTVLTKTVLTKPLIELTVLTKPRIELTVLTKPMIELTVLTKPMIRVDRTHQATDRVDHTKKNVTKNVEHNISSKKNNYCFLNILFAVRRWLVGVVV